MDIPFIQAVGATVLVVDDNPVNLKVAEGLLKSFHIEADCAGGGAEAIQKIHAKHYDIVFLDYLMPEMNGVETTAILRGEGYTHEKLCIVALSAHSSEEIRQTLVDAGMQDFLPKPIDKVLLNEILLQYLPAEKIQGSEAEKQKTAARIEKYREIGQLQVDAMLQKHNGNLAEYEFYLTLFVKNIPAILDILPSRINDPKKLASLVHGLQILLENAGALELARRAGEIETALLCNDEKATLEIPEFINHLKTLHTRILSAKSDNRD